jgi:short-subunit dehydrogenase
MQLREFGEIEHAARAGLAVIRRNIVEYRGKTALVTGASSGIGTAFAEALAGRGCDLVLVARSAGALAVLAQRLRSEHGVRVETLAQDLTAPGAAQAVQQETDRLGLGVNILVNNAGFGSVGRFDTIAAQRSAREVALDVAAVVELAHAFLPGMVARGEGAVVNVASTAAFQPVPYMSVYGASKAFVLSFSQALWAEYRSLGVRVLALCPGPVDTNFFAVAGTREVGKRAAVGRPKTPEAGSAGGATRPRPESVHGHPGARERRTTRTEPAAATPGATCRRRTPLPGCARHCRTWPGTAPDRPTVAPIGVSHP